MERYNKHGKELNTDKQTAPPELRDFSVMKGVFFSMQVYKAANISAYLIRMTNQMKATVSAKNERSKIS